MNTYIILQLSVNTFYFKQKIIIFQQKCININSIYNKIYFILNKKIIMILSTGKTIVMSNLILSENTSFDIKLYFPKYN